MSCIHGRNILLYTIIGIGIAFSLTTSSIIYCAPGKKPMGKINKSINKLNQEIKPGKKFIGEINRLDAKLRSMTKGVKKEDPTRQMDFEKLDISVKNILSDIEALDFQNFVDNQGKLITEPQVDKVDNDSIIANSSKVSESLDAINKNLDPNRNFGNIAKALDEALTEYHLKDRAESLDNFVDTQLNNYVENEDSEVQQVFNGIAESIRVSQTLFNDDSDYIKGQVVNGDGMPPQSTTSVYDTPRPIYDVPKRSQPVCTDKVPDGTLSVHNTPTHMEGVNNDNIPQTTSNEDIYTSKNNNNLHSAQVNTRRKRSVPYNSDGDELYSDNRDKHGSNQDNDDIEDYYMDDDLSDKNIHTHKLHQDDDHIYEEIPPRNRRDAVDVNNSSNKNNLYQDDDHIYEEIPLHDSKDTVDAPAKLNDSNDEHNANQDNNDEKETDLDAPNDTTAHVESRSDDNIHSQDTNDATTSAINADHNSANNNDDKELDGNKPNNNIQDEKETDLDASDDTTAHVESRSDDNTHSQDTNDATTSAINADHNLANNNDDKELDGDEPNNDIIADKNNQLSNTYNQKKAIAHGNHVIFSQLFNSANDTALHRISSRLTAYALNQTMAGQFSSQKLVSSGSNISNVQHEVWMMPLIKKGEKYVDSVSKYTISTYGINVGFDSKIPHCRGNIESVLGTVFAFYNSQLKYTASDSATLLNTYIISMYYSIIFNQKFFIYTLFSFGTSNAGNCYSTTEGNNTSIYNPEPFSSYNAFRQSVELHAGYNIMVYDSKLHDRQIVLLPMVGVQIDTVALHSDTKQYYSSVQQLKLSTGMKIAYHKRINPSTSINSALYGFVNYCPWSDTIHNDQSLMSNLENGTLVEKENLATSNNKLYYRIGGEASLQYNRVMYSLRYEMNLAQDYLSHQVGLKIKLKF